MPTYTDAQILEWFGPDKYSAEERDAHWNKEHLSPKAESQESKPENKGQRESKAFVEAYEFYTGEKE